MTIILTNTIWIGLISYLLTKKYGNLASFRQDLNKLSRLKPRKSHTKEKRIIVLNSTLEWYEYVNFSFSKTRKLGPEYDPKNVFLNDYGYDVWYENLDDKTFKKSDDKTF